MIAGEVPPVRIDLGNLEVGIRIISYRLTIHLREETAG